MYYYLQYPQYIYQTGPYIQQIRPEIPAVPPPPPIFQTPSPPILSIDLPKFKYEKQKIIPVPFDPHITNGKFDTISEAIKFIIKHVHHFHGQPNRNLVYAYLPFCRVFNAQLGDYISASLMPKKVIETTYRRLSDRSK